MNALIDGRYEVLSKIKEGGMGALYKVRHVHLEDVRVIKVMRTQIEDDPDARKRFYREARLAKGLQHPNVAALLDFAEDAALGFYMVMEYVDGPNLSELVGLTGPLPVAVVLDVAVQGLRALGYVHARGIVHRDVSPENLMLTLEENRRLHVKLIDLGVAKETEGSDKTTTGMFLGKLRYASPEQLGSLKKGEAIDGRSDVYSMGCLLYQLLTGTDPYQASTAHAYAMLHLMKSPRAFEETDAAHRVPEELRQAVMKALARSRDDRWATAEELASVLEEIAWKLPADERSPAVGTRVVAAFEEFRARREKEEAEARAAGPIEVIRRSTSFSSPLSDAEGPEPSPTPRLVAPGEASPARPQLTPRPAGGPSVAVLAAGAVALLAVVVLGTLAVAKWKGAPPVPGAPGVLLVTSTPWGRIVSVTAVGNGGLVAVSDEVTPVRLSLPAGRYTVRVRGGAGVAGTEAAAAGEVVAGRETPLHVDLPGFDLEAAVRAAVP